jgi:soluble lytic murein transglycosylase-like protein
MRKILRTVEAEIGIAADELGVDPELMLAIATIESALRPHAYRYEPGFWLRYLANNPAYRGEHPGRVSASYGVMQVMYPTAVDHGFTGTPEDLFNVAVNVREGAKILKALLSQADGNVWEAVAAYNGGWGGRRLPAPMDYADRVRAVYQRFKRRMNNEPRAIMGE